ncbi:hypothetical protein SK854_15450 [Lentzea sp. BCCO 10_0061]|uniref:Penicillin-binding protein n=1 Tax=Lentzea sokolovensis TaxID=3095429 RepID=A0ABU4UW76_9PSEU|nr:hypothetical protein [Lentzea sp. BCCO 10_0061]MDX8143520.1 hypothetical protein [Lentzea sp. BCCO 10_0061]
MRRVLAVLGALVLVIVGAVVWQRSGEPPSRYVVLQHADASELWRSGDPETPLVRQVARELATRGSLSLDKLRRDGAVVVTTIDAKAQSGAAAAIREKASGRSGLVAVDPARGAVRAYAPGEDPAVDRAGGVVKQPGPVFFPFSAAAAAQEGKALDQGDAERAVRVAQRAGVPEYADIEGTRTKLLDGPDGGLRPLDLASGYATFAAEGVHRDAHFVTHVTDVHGATLYQALDTPQPAFDRDPVRSKEIANQVNEVLRNDPACGNDLWTACREGVWPTGMRHAWFAGATPELSVAVFVGGDEAGGAVDAGLPKAVWETFLQKLRP